MPDDRIHEKIERAQQKLLKAQARLHKLQGRLAHSPRARRTPNRSRGFRWLGWVLGAGGPWWTSLPWGDLFDKLKPHVQRLSDHVDRRFNEAGQRLGEFDQPIATPKAKPTWTFGRRAR